jgi:hypothetical protein
VRAAAAVAHHNDNGPVPGHTTRAKGRRMKTISLTLCCLALAACASVPPEQRADGAAPAKKEEDKVVCLREAPTASRLTQTRCYTMRSLEERARADREAADRIPTRPHDSTVGGS